MGGGTKSIKRKLFLRKIHLFVMEKYVKGVEQDQRNALDLLESMMKPMPTDSAKEELRRNTVKMNQFRPHITEIRICTIQMSVQSISILNQPSSRPINPKTLVLARQGSRTISEWLRCLAFRSAGKLR